MRKLGYFIAVSANLLASNAYAKDFLVSGKCELIVASRSTLDESKEYISRNLNPDENTRIFLSQNGWYAISIGSLWPNEEQPVMQKWKAVGKIPQDSLCSSGSRYVQAYDWRTGQVWQRPEVSVPVYSTPETPRACSNPRGFCTELSLKAAACGWGGQTAAELAFDADTGATGSAISGGVCTALLSDAEGLEIDAIDLALAAGSSAALKNAEQSFEDGDLLGTFFGLVLAGGTGALGIAKCEASLQNACR